MSEPFFVIPGLTVGVFGGAHLPPFPGELWGGFLGMYVALKLHSHYTGASG